MAYGVNLIAMGQEVNAIAQSGSEPFPRFREIATELDSRYGSDRWLLGFADHWGTLNGYTHSGLEQLGRRFRRDGNISPTHGPESIALYR